MTCVPDARPRRRARPRIRSAGTTAPAPSSARWCRQRAIGAVDAASARRPASAAPGPPRPPTRAGGWCRSTWPPAGSRPAQFSAQYCARNSMSAMPPGSCFRSNSPGVGARQLAAHAVAHVPHVRAQASRAARAAPAPRGASPRSAARSVARAGDRARVQQRLVLPGPGLAPLVVGEGLDAGDQQARPCRSDAAAYRPRTAARRAECIVSRCTMRCAKRTKNTWLSIARAPSVSCCAPLRVVQEHQVQIRAVAELHAAELAVADHAQSHRPARRRLAAHRHAELRRELLPGRAPARARRSARRHRSAGR